MGETENAMQYDEELIFKHLSVTLHTTFNCFSIDCPSGAFTLIRWITPLKTISLSNQINMETVLKRSK